MTLFLSHKAGDYQEKERSKVKSGPKVLTESLRKREREGARCGFEVCQCEPVAQRGLWWMEEDGWREGSSEDKCALSFQSERNPLQEAHIYSDRNSCKTTGFFLNVRKKSSGSWRRTYQRNLNSNFGLGERSLCPREGLIFKDALRTQEG